MSNRWAERRAQGLCGECGVIPSDRYASCGLCRTIMNERRRRWWARVKKRENAKRRRAVKNTDQRRQAQRARYWDHRAEEAIRHAIWYAANRDVIAAKHRAYYHAHKARISAARRERRARALLQDATSARVPASGAVSSGSEPTLDRVPHDAQNHPDLSP